MRRGPCCSLVLTDVNLSGRDGLTLLDTIGADFPGLPVVMLTGLQDVHVASAFRHGAIDYIVRPFDRVRVLAVVHRALEHGRRLRQDAVYRQNLEDAILDNAMHTHASDKDLERSYDLTIQALGNALDLRDTETQGHSRRVTAYTMALARTMKLGADELRTIARGAFLHDVGKIATPDRILLKPGKLDPDETAIMREHSAHGYEMIRKLPFLQEAAEIVYAHHEAFDGTGYPRGLHGEDIPLGARIFAIADTLDAITSDRPYRKGCSFGEARAEIARCSGTQFDPALVAVFLDVPDAFWINLRSEVECGSASGSDISRIDSQPSRLRHPTAQPNIAMQSSFGGNIPCNPINPH